MTVLRYGCFNRAPLADHVIVQDGWQKVVAVDPNFYGERMYMDVAVRRDILIPNPMTKECIYSISAEDPRCDGCKHNQGQATPKDETL